MFGLFGFARKAKKATQGGKITYLETRYNSATRQSEKLISETQEEEDIKGKSEYLELLKFQCQELERANKEMDRILDQNYKNAVAAGKAAAAKKIAEMDPYEDTMKAFREALEKGKSKKD